MPTALLGESFSALGSDGDPARPQRLGEVEMADGDVHGIAAHIMALAGPGEVVVSGVIPPLVLGSRIAFADRGSHKLKGLPDRWPALAVRDTRG
jgi:hypothetical protein